MNLPPEGFAKVVTGSPNQGFKTNDVRVLKVGEARREVVKYIYNTDLLKK